MMHHFYLSMMTARLFHSANFEELRDGAQSRNLSRKSKSTKPSIAHRDPIDGSSGKIRHRAMAR
jgi:hypothetical protein